MPKTDTDTCNQAIGNIGISKTIANLEQEQSTEARVCRTFFENTRDMILEEVPWPFATRFADLQDIGDPPAGWLYRYRYPNDCVTARQLIIDGYQAISVNSRPVIPFLVVEDEAAAGRAIVTNQPNAILEYTARITNPMLYSALFIDAFAWALSVKIASPLSAAPGMAEKAQAAYNGALAKAAARSFNEAREEQSRESEFTRARL